MIPLVPTLALAFLSFAASAFVVLRIVIPILPPGPFSRRVPPSEFGLPNFRTLTPADKSHLWLASCDLLALVAFIWEAISEAIGSPQDAAIAFNGFSAGRFWFAMTIRPTCLLLIASLTLLHVRMARPVSFGAKGWIMLAPLAIMILAGTGIAAVLGVVSTPTLFGGILAYNAVVAVAASISFVSLVVTLIIIKRNLAKVDEPSDSWPPMRQVEDRPRPSFTSEDVNCLRDGDSWITSNASSRPASVSAFSFSTHHSMRPPTPTSMRLKKAMGASHPSIPAKSSFWFNPATPHNAEVDGEEIEVPPVPALPSPYGPALVSPTGLAINDDVDPFHRQPSPLPEGLEQRTRQFGSQTSWLTSNSGGSEATLSAWSFPTTHATHAQMQLLGDKEQHSDGRTSRDNQAITPTAVSRPYTPALSSAQPLGGYGYAPEAVLAEKGPTPSVPSGDLDVSIYRALGWLISIWVPFGLSLPYFCFAMSANANVPSIASIFLVLSITLSSPLLATNLILRSPIPVPTGLFEVYSEPPSIVNRSPSPEGLERLTREYKRSGSVTVVEGKRSTDVWIAHGDAKDGSNKLGRAFTMLQPKPKLSVLPPEIEEEAEPSTPPLPMQMPTSPNDATVPPTPTSGYSAEMGRVRKESKASSRYSEVEASVAHAARVMIAQKHYSAVARTFILPPSPEQGRASLDAMRMSNEQATATGVTIRTVEAPSHIRARSTSSISVANSMMASGPPSEALPPTPENVRKARARRTQQSHKRAQSSISITALTQQANDSGFSFGAVDNVNEIDALSAKVLPILIPGLKVGEGMKITQDWKLDRVGTLKGSNAPTSPGCDNFSSFGEFSSPEVHSTPLRNGKGVMQKKTGHKKHHFSLPSLSLGKDGFQVPSWMPGQHDHETIRLVTEDGRRNSHVGISEDAPLTAVREEDERRASALDVPAGVNTARSSLLTLLEQAGLPPIPSSAASEATLFDFDATGPQAESTPHDRQAYVKKLVKEEIPPVPSVKRSSIVYIKSGDQTGPVQVAASRKSSITYRKNDENSAPGEQSNVHRTLSGRLARAVRPLRPKSNKSKGSVSPSTADENAAPASPGLKPLLLQQRDLNVASDASNGIKPLSLGKKKRSALAVVDENEASKPLARSETGKLRAALRKTEVLPDVVVRPPSSSEHVGYSYTFR